MVDESGKPEKSEAPDLPKAELGEEVHEAPKTRCKACDDCHALRENVSPGIPVNQEVKQLYTPEEVRDYPGLTRSTDDQHIADLDGIEAAYELGTNVECSLKGGHLHQNGFIVKALCGMTLSMGKDCGARFIIGFKEARSRFNRRKSFQTNVARAQSWRAGVGARFERYFKAFKQRREVVETTERLLKLLYKELSSRAKAKPPKTAVRPESPRNREEHLIVQNIVGLTLFSDDGEKLISKMQRAIQNYEAEVPAGPLGEETAKNLARYAMHFDDAVVPLERWLDESGRFMTKANLEVAVAAIHKPNPTVVEEPDGFRVSYFPGETALLRWSRK